MVQFIEGIDWQLTVLLPDCLDDYVDQSSSVRAIDAFVDMLGLAELGFQTSPAATGRPGYHPGLMLRIYLFGYLNQIQSSRRLERECGRNRELIWLTGQLKPDMDHLCFSERGSGHE
ncbi:MAG: transposase, partial [Pseudomonadota bacterium]